VLCTDKSIQNVNKTRRKMREVHVSHMLPSFWYRIEHDPIRSKFLVAERMTHEQSFWYEILVPVLGRRTWVMCLTVGFMPQMHEVLGSNYTSNLLF